MGSRGKKSKADEWLTEDNLIVIEGLARDKKTDKDIAKNYIGVAERTFSEWKARYPALKAALKKGRIPVAEKIEKSLYDLCDVQEYTDTIYEEFRDANGIVTSSHVRKIKRQVPPNTTALIFALKNLKPQKWRDKQEIKSDIKLETEAPKLYEALRNPATDCLQEIEELKEKSAEDGDGE